METIKDSAGFQWSTRITVNGSQNIKCFSQAARQHLQGVRRPDAPLRFLHVVFHAALVINHAVHIKHAVGGAGVSVPGLADGTHVNKVLVGFEKLDVPGFIFLDAPFMADEGAGTCV